MHAWRGWNSSKKDLVCRRVEKCRLKKAEQENARTAAETKAKETRERTRVIKQQQRFRDVRDENFLKGDRISRRREVPDFADQGERQRRPIPELGPASPGRPCATSTCVHVLGAWIRAMAVVVRVRV